MTLNEAIFTLADLVQPNCSPDWTKPSLNYLSCSYLQRNHNSTQPELISRPFLACVTRIFLNIRFNIDWTDGIFDNVYVVVGQEHFRSNYPVALWKLNFLSIWKKNIFNLLCLFSGKESTTLHIFPLLLFTCSSVLTNPPLCEMKRSLGRND